MFGRSGSKRAERYVEWGLKRRLNEEARSEYIMEVGEVLESMGILAPPATQGRHYL
jgi:1,2-phenylacetyl-CoA epoxidase catalytic subunit